MEGEKQWFVTRGDKQYGPVSFEDLKFEAGRGELNPRLDLVWKQGMDQWIPAGEIDGLFQRNREAGAAEAVAAGVTFTEYQPELSEEEKKLIRGEWTGVGRGTYFFIIHILPYLWIAGLAFAASYAAGKVEKDIIAFGTVALSLVPLILMFSATLKRFVNLAMSRLWFFGLFVPLINIWVGYRLFACPPGYAYHKKLDAIGWILALLYWGGLLLLIASIAYTVYVLGTSPEDDPIRKQLEAHFENIRQFKPEP